MQIPPQPLPPRGDVASGDKIFRINSIFDSYIPHISACYFWSSHVMSADRASGASHAKSLCRCIAAGVCLT